MWIQRLAASMKLIQLKFPTPTSAHPYRAKGKINGTAKLILFNESFVDSYAQNLSSTKLRKQSLDLLPVIITAWSTKMTQRCPLDERSLAPHASITGILVKVTDKQPRATSCLLCLVSQS